MNFTQKVLLGTRHGDNLANDSRLNPSLSIFLTTLSWTRQGAGEGGQECSRPGNCSRESFFPLKLVGGTGGLPPGKEVFTVIVLYRSTVNGNCLVCLVAGDLQRRLGVAVIFRGI